MLCECILFNAADPWIFRTRASCVTNAVFGFLAGFMLGKPIPLCGHPQQRLTFMPIVRLVGVTTTFLRAFSVMISRGHLSEGN